MTALPLWNGRSMVRTSAADSCFAIYEQERSPGFASLVSWTRSGGVAASAETAASARRSGRPYVAAGLVSLTEVRAAELPEPPSR